jgi:hypothetical protein
MARLAQRPKIGFRVSAFGKRYDVMDFIGGNMKSTFKAVFTERILGDVKISNLTPTVVIVLGVAMSAVVLAGDRSLVSGTITLTSNVFETTAVCTAFKRFLWDI